MSRENKWSYPFNAKPTEGRKLLLSVDIVDVSNGNIIEGYYKDGLYVDNKGERIEAIGLYEVALWKYTD